MGAVHSVIPSNRLSTEPHPADFYDADAIEPANRTTDYELGGIGLNDPSAGLQYQIWVATYDPDTGDVSLEAPNTVQTVIFNALEVTELSLAFDQNMRPFFAFVQNGQAKFRWYDTVLGANRITDLDPSDISPRCCLDDKRELQVTQGNVDIILAYVRNNNLYYRQQRDRYEVEYLLKEEVNGVLLRVGMNKEYRLQFYLEATA
jgi:hypothetical protein